MRHLRCVVFRVVFILEGLDLSNGRDFVKVFSGEAWISVLISLGHVSYYVSLSRDFRMDDCLLGNSIGFAWRSHAEEGIK